MAKELTKEDRAFYIDAIQNLNNEEEARLACAEAGLEITVSTLAGMKIQLLEYYKNSGELPKVETEVSSDTFSHKRCLFVMTWH